MSDTLSQQLADTIADSSRPQWMSGLEPEMKPMTLAGDSWFILAVAVLLLLILFNYRSLWRMLSFCVDEMFTIREGRDNVFDERPTALSGIRILLVVIFAFCGGFMLAAVVSPPGLSAFPELAPRSVLINMALVGAYYIFDLLAYNAVGFTFTSDEGRREWVRGFAASVSVLAVALLPTVLFSLFYPTLIHILAVVAVILFLLAKFIFILKGFRIFYDNFLSLLYFILYLCTLEIIPIILVYNCSVRIV